MDITVHEVEKNGQLKEVERASGGYWGGISVERAFKSALAEIVTEKMIERYSQKYPDEYLDLFRDFERKKYTCRKGQVCTLKIPISFNHECLETFGKDLTTLVNNSSFKNNFIFSPFDRLRIKSFETFFETACDRIINHLKNLFQSPKVEDVDKILMVGGFSESCILQEAIRNAFPNCHIIVPKEAGLAVLRGAVMLGLYPQTVTSRVARLTYGVDINAVFDPAIHDESKKEVIEGVEYCTGIFDKHVEIGDQLACGEAYALRFYIPITKQQDFVFFRICSSSESNPLYIDSPGCTVVGTGHMPVPVESKDRVVYVRMRYDFTEITLEAIANEATKRFVCKLNTSNDYFS